MIFGEKEKICPYWNRFDYRQKLYIVLYIENKLNQLEKDNNNNK